MKSVTLGDIDVAYNEAGEGPAVVLIHGLAEGSATWAVQQRELASCHTYAYDLRGHGGSTLGDADGSLEQLGRDLVAFLEKVSGPAVVVGFSLGGTVALWAAAERPDLVTRVVAMGTSSVVGRGALGFYDDRIAKASDTASAAFHEAMHADTVAALVRKHDTLESIIDARLEAVGDGQGYANAARAMKALNASPLTPRLPDVQVPVTVVGGSDDAFCPYKAAKIIIDALPDAVYQEIPEAGHLMNVDNPRAVTTALLSILDRQEEFDHG